MSDNADNDILTATDNQRRRRRLMLLFGLLFAVAGTGYGSWWALAGRFVENTDDAYVAGDVVQVMPQTAGTVLAIHAEDTDVVQAGEPLVRLDRADAQLALDQAEAHLAQTVRQVRTLFANSDSLAATVRAREADLDKARDDLARRTSLTGSGAVSHEVLDHARSTLAGAEAALASAREQYTSNQALIDHTTIQQHPNVAEAAARVREAWLALERTEIPAPVSGQIAKRAVQVGQRVQPGSALMAVVPLDQLWVDANFKEGQLRQMRIGQPVTLTSDLYGNSVVFHGHVAGLSAGTGAAFALLPAQNASGNWIKVVQRLPVRIALDPHELEAHPLRLGLSMQVAVDIRDQRGGQLGQRQARDTPVASTSVYERDGHGADGLVDRIIAANLHGVAVGTGAEVPAATGSPASQSLIATTVGHLE